METMWKKTDSILFSFDVNNHLLEISVPAKEKELTYKNVPDSLFEEYVIPTEDWQIVKKLFSDFENGILPEDVEFRWNRPNTSEFSWCRVIPIKEINDGTEHMLYGLVQNTDEKHRYIDDAVQRICSSENREVNREQMLLRSACFKEYVALFIIDGNTKEGYEWIRHPMNLDQRFTYIQNVDEASKDYYMRYSDSKNVDNLVEQIKLDNILKQLEKQDSYRVVFDGRNETGIARSYAIEFFYIDKESKQICCTISDVTILASRHKEQQEVLKQSLEREEAALNAKNNFFANMSHEIRTPLNAIVGMAEIARMEVHNAKKVMECMDIMISSSQSLVNVVSDILDSGSVQSGTIKLIEKPTNVKDVLEKVVEDFKSAQMKPKQTILVDLKVKHEMAMIDADRLSRLTSNLLANAAKFSPEKGQLELHLSEKPGKDDKEGFYRIEIVDYGKGISQEDLKHVFEPFYRDKDSAANYLSGTGLGLSVVKSIVDAKGATIDIESEPGVGTKVVVVAPMKFVEEKARSAGAEINTHLLEGKRVLLVEDQPINMLVAKRMLERFSATVDTAEHGKYAVDQFMSHPENTYDVIFMDIQMPIMDGYEATKAIRESGRSDANTVKIVSMTANVLPEDIEKAKQEHMDAHIGKPIRTEDLQNLIISLMEA
ncbi:MAG: response regulator [Lachnospiraceae bacterium]|nr:response regulator [Lachnospiraceae bacterium]